MWRVIYAFVCMNTVTTVSKKKVILGVAVFALLLCIPLTLSVISQQQNENSRAAAAASLSFSPDSSTSAPIQSSVGSTIDVDLYVDPGTSEVSFVRYQVSYDPTKIQPVAANPVTLNSPTFTNVEGPVTNSGTLAQSVSIGSDPSKAITQKTKIATLHFTAVGSTNGTTTSITFGTLSQALSEGPSEQANQNVLSTTIPAFITISGTGSPSTAPIPTVTGTALNFQLLLHGVGSAGDNPNPTASDLSNKNPLHPQRNLKVQVSDTNNHIIASSSAAVTYNATSGMFEGAVGLPSTLASGDYSVKIQTDRYLIKLVPGIQQIVIGQTTQIPPVQMIAGDTNNDNVLNALDYNALLDCGYGDLNPLPINDPNSTFNSQACQVHTPAMDVDINDDGIINSTDYNLFVRELSVQNGD